MANQLLNSVVFTQDKQQEIVQQLTDIRNKMDFLLTMLPENVRSLTKIGNQFALFVDKAYLAVSSHPEIMPTVFNTDEYLKVYTLMKELTPIATQIVELANCVQYTMLAAKNDVMVGSLEIYAAVKQNQEKVLGLNVLAEEMSSFYQRPSKKNTVPLKKTVNQ